MQSTGRMFHPGAASFICKSGDKRIIRASSCVYHLCSKPGLQSMPQYPTPLPPFQKVHSAHNSVINNSEHPCPSA